MSGTIVRTLGAACAAALLTVIVPVEAYAVDIKKPVVKTQAPTGADCLAQAQAAADKVKAAGGDAKAQQAAYGRAKVNCQSKM